MMDKKETIASAPGKVLLAGGYLVLDCDYTGLVFGLSARIHTHVKSIPTQSEDKAIIVVTSPQFKTAQWSYDVVQGPDFEVGIKQTSNSVNPDSSRNPFVETTLNYVLSYASAFLPRARPLQSSQITVLADTSYYTKPSGTSIMAGEADEPPFIDFGVKLSDAHKTGLGSSAALVTSLTAALLDFYLPERSETLRNPTGRKRLHNLAQAAHCAAQGKIGSGFDVASAVFGSCLYRRFSPELLQKLGDASSPDFARHLQTLVDESDEANKWDVEIQKDKVKMPKGLRLIMCDVDCGSETPGMVKQVLSWRQREPEEADMLWGQLQRKNEALATALTRASENGLDAGKEAIRNAVKDIRILVQDMSRLSGVPIEPSSQTQLLDRCSAIPGVLGGVVPGAGGYDAVALLVENTEKTISELSSLLADYAIETAKKDADNKIEPTTGKVSILDVREEMEGVRWEMESQRYSSWL